MIAILCSAALAVISHPLAAGADSATSGVVVVKTRPGSVRGLINGHTRKFMGIPFAAPPVGKLRWEPPQPHADWTGILDAARPGSSCPQMSFSGSRLEGSEDCLYLNVYTPNPAGSGLPVMVWIHGGSFIMGSGADYDGTMLAQKGNLIVVTINYRLGPLGFLASRSIERTSPDHTSGNYGIMDQQVAFKWVKENIAAFGGDPSRVTIAGESAGGQSVGLQIVSPLAAGLFQRAILESGPFISMRPIASTRTLAEQDKHSDEFIGKLGCSGAYDVLACLRDQPLDQVMRALPASPIGQAEPVWAPVIDGHVVPTEPGDALRAGKFNKVPVISGSNHDEGTLFMAYGQQLSVAQYEAGLRHWSGDKAPQALEAYPASKYSTPLQALAAVFGDRILSCPIIGATELLSTQVPVFQYEFNDPHAPGLFPNPPFPLGASHGSEIPYVFGSASQRASATPEQQRLSDAMMQYWIDFILTGDPDGHQPRWNRYSDTTHQVLSLAPGAIRMESDFRAEHHCDLWESMDTSGLRVGRAADGQ